MFVIFSKAISDVISVIVVLEYGIYLTILQYLPQHDILGLFRGPSNSAEQNGYISLAYLHCISRGQSKGYCVYYISVLTFREWMKIEHANVYRKSEMLTKIYIIILRFHALSIYLSISFSSRLLPDNIIFLLMDWQKRTTHAQEFRDLQHAGTVIVKLPGHSVKNEGLLYIYTKLGSI